MKRVVVYAVILAAFLAVFSSAGTISTIWADEPALSLAVDAINRDCGRFQAQVARMNEGNVDLLWLGDSITEFWETAGKDVWKRHFEEKNRNAMNFGISGDRTGHLIWRLENAPMEKIHPKMSIVMIGTNNFPSGYTPEETVEGINIIVEKLRTLYPDMKILLFEIFPREEDPNHPFQEAVNKANEELRGIYAGGKVQNVTLCGIGDLFLDQEGKLQKELMPDFLHPSEAGYEIWASAAEPFIIEGLDEKISLLDPKPSEIHKELFPQHCQALRDRKDYQILMMGDSEVSYWTYHAGPEHTYVWDKYYGSKGAVNLGVGGDTVPGLLWRYEHYPLDGIDPKLIIFEIGVNDITSVESPKEEVAYGVRYLAKTVHARWPKAHIIAMATLPFQYKGNPKHSWQTFQSWVNDYNAVFPLYFRDLSYVTTVNIGDLFVYPNGEVNKNAMPDDVHPSTLGFILWGERLNPLVERLLNEYPYEEPAGK